MKKQCCSSVWNIQMKTVKKWIILQVSIDVWIFFGLPLKGARYKLFRASWGGGAQYLINKRQI